MTALDIMFLFAVGLGLVFGVMRGFTKSVLSLGTWLLVIVALWLLHAPVASALEGVVGTVSGAYVLAFALIVLLVWLGGKLLVRQLSGSVKRSAIGGLDRILGGGFGALKGLVGVALLYMAFSLVYDTIWGRDAVRPLWIAQARTYPLVHAASNAIVDLVEVRRSRRYPDEAAGDASQAQ